jgi:glycosyltransferase involved in cell wall biosynthesis
LAKDVPGLCREMARRGHPVTLFATDQDGSGHLRVPTDRYVEQDGYQVRYFRTSAGPRFFQRWGVSLAYEKALGADVPEADVVHIYSLYNFSSWRGAFHAHRNSIPYVMELHGSMDDIIFSHHRGRKRLYEYLLMHGKLQHAAAIRFLTEAEAATARKNFRGEFNSVIVPTGLDVQERPATYAPFSAYGIDERSRDHLIVFIGRLHRKKGLDLLAKAFIAVAQRNPLAYLVIIGPDEGMQSEVEDILTRTGLRSRVTFTGLLTGAPKVSLIAAARVVVVPSYGENFCNVVIEALALGVPVVLTDRVALYPQVVTADAGIVVRTDSAEIARALEVMLGDRAHARAMGEAGKQLVKRSFTWKGVGDQLEQVYSQFLAGRGRARLG